jgi:hypothetical protein
MNPYPNLINQHVRQLRLAMIASFLFNVYTNTLPFHAVRSSLRKPRTIRRFDTHMGTISEVHTAVLMKIQVSWGKTPCRFANNCRYFGRLSPVFRVYASPMNYPDPKDWSRKLVGNVGNYSHSLRGNTFQNFIYVGVLQHRNGHAQFTPDGLPVCQRLGYSLLNQQHKAERWF